MERIQSLLENLVEYNLSESGVSPVRVEELLGDDFDVNDLLNVKLSYAWAGGSPELRESIADFYPGATGANVRVTNGSSEANFMEFWGLLDKNDRAAIQLPNYLQTWGLARHFAGRVETFRLNERAPWGAKASERTWELDLEGLERAVTKRTKLILVTNPNNPSGHVLSEAEMDAVVEVAERANVWIISDEVYRGAELQGETSPTFFGRYPRVIVTGGLSKAFALPGLRTGWMVGPPKVVERLEKYHDYLTLTPAILSERLASLAMQPARRDWLIERTRTLLRTQWPQLREWIDAQNGVLQATAPMAGAIAMIRYKLPISGNKLFDRLYEEKSVLVNPASHFGITGKYFRVGYGYDIDHTLKGLDRVSELIEELRTEA